MSGVAARVEALKAVAKSGTAAEHEELLPKLARYLDYFHLLTEVGKTLTSTLKREELIDNLMRSIAQLMEPQDWALLLLDRETQELYFDIVVGEAADKIKHMRLALGEGIAGWVATHRTPAVVADTSKDSRFSTRVDEVSSLVTQSVLAVPLVSRNELLGVLELIRTSDHPEPYTQADLEVLTPFADFVAIALENVSAFQRVEDLTLVDEWTGLYNARYLQQSVPDELTRSARYRYPLSLIFVDLDNFKAVNDTHGHATGSGLLRTVARFLRGETRETDRTARYGGDEFVVVAPHTDKTDAMMLGQRLAERLAAEVFTVGDVEGLKVTASIGVATFPDDGESPETLLEAADRAMYMSKALGRNRVSDADSLSSKK
ncbi:MAG: sensor domain-containing diguanylate cyclase [Myxococcota bacterium]